MKKKDEFTKVPCNVYSTCQQFLLLTLVVSSGVSSAEGSEKKKSHKTKPGNTSPISNKGLLVQ